jgi:hypothetical protein
VNPKIDKIEMSQDDHGTLKASGPIEWDSDEVSATFVVVIAQLKPQGRIVYATGRTKRTFWPADDRWEAEATVADPDDRFMYGDATGWAVASVKEDNGAIEPYPWEVVALTIERPAVAVAQ